MNSSNALGSPSGYTYLTGDLFVSEADDVNLTRLFQNEFSDGVALVNLEGVPRCSGVPSSKAVSLSLNSSVFDLKNSENILFSVANNHSSDYGKGAFSILLKGLAGRVLLSPAEAKDPSCELNNHRFVFFADEREQCKCRDYSFLRFDQSVIAKHRAVLKGAIVVVHGGLEYRRHPTPYQRKLAHLAVDFGALAVIFHHSHIVGACENYKGVVIHYGLGNFYFSKVGDLHGIAEIDGVVLRFSRDTTKFEVAKVVYEHDESGAVLTLKFRQLSEFEEMPSMNVYADWYKKKYPLDSSFRPRQLFEHELLVNAQFVLWSWVSGPLVAFGVSKKVKSLLKTILG